MTPEQLQDEVAKALTIIDDYRKQAKALESANARLREALTFVTTADSLGSAQVVAWRVLREVTPTVPPALKHAAGCTINDGFPCTCGLILGIVPPVQDNSYIEVRSSACHAGSDGDCSWKECPQLHDDEPEKSGRSCPLGKLPNPMLVPPAK